MPELHTETKRDARPFFLPPRSPSFSVSKARHRLLDAQLLPQVLVLRLLFHLPQMLLCPIDLDLPPREASHLALENFLRTRAPLPRLRPAIATSILSQLLSVLPYDFDRPSRRRDCGWRRERLPPRE